ncbi:hypothetical protein NMG60_11023699 [Bertholletia excelsa]
MENLLPELLVGYFTVRSVAYSAKRSTKKLFSNPPAAQFHAPPPNTSVVHKGNAGIRKTSKVGEKRDHLGNGSREHGRSGPNISEMVKGKLRLGTKLLQVGGAGKIFKKNFSVGEGEKLLKVSQCYLSTTAGPIAGLLFISTDKVAFISDRAIKLSTSSNGQLVKIHYKVVIPLGKIKIAHEGLNTKKPSRKYIEIVTTDNFDFWFMGFLNYRKTSKCLHQAISLVHQNVQLP